MKNLKMTPEMSFDDILVQIKNCSDDVTVELSEGRYFLKKSLRITENLGHSVTFKANGKVFFDGGIIIDNSLVKKCDNEEILSRIIEADSRKHIYEIDLSSYKIDYAEYGCRGFRRAYVPSANEFYINSEAQQVPRYPKSGDIPITEVTDPGSRPKSADFTMRPATFKYDDPRCDLWKDADDFYVSGYFNESYADDTIKAAKIDTENKTITTALPHLFAFSARPHTRWHAINLIEELSCEGEYYIDKVREKLYFYPADGTDLSTALLQLSVLDTPMVVLRNTADITFEGITFENTRGTCIYMDNTENCLIKNCVLRNAGMLAAQIGMGATAMPEGMHDAHGIQHESVGTPKSVPEIVGSWHEMLYQFAAWDNEGGVLDIKSEIERTHTGKNSFSAWDEAGKVQNNLVNAILSADCHTIVTMRTKMAYAMEQNDRGKTVPVKIGLAPVQRENTEYEFDIVLNIARNHIACASKDTTFLDSWSDVITPELGRMLKEWLDNGADPERCTDCGQIIRAAKGRSAGQIVEGTVKNYGRKLCWNCMVKEINKRKKEEKENAADAEKS